MSGNRAKEERRKYHLNEDRKVMLTEMVDSYW